MIIYDCTQFLGKHGGNGQAGSGCIPGCVKLEINKPHDTYRHDGGGDTLIHVEAGKDAIFGDKKQLLAARSVIDTLSQKAAIENPECKQWWYCPPCLRSEWLAASLGDRAAQASIKQWRSLISDVILAGIPGPDLRGVCVDLYDFWSIRAVWLERTKENVMPWLKIGRRVLPILYLRWKDTGVLYTELEARNRIEVAAALCGGRVAIFDGLDIHDQKEQYETWPLRGLIESMAGAK